MEICSVCSCVMVVGLVVLIWSRIERGETFLFLYKVMAYSCSCPLRGKTTCRLRFNFVLDGVQHEKSPPYHLNPRKSSLYDRFHPLVEFKVISSRGSSLLLP